MATPGEMKAMILADGNCLYDFDPADITEDVWAFALSCNAELFEDPPHGIPGHFLSQDFLKSVVGENGLLAKYMDSMTEELAYKAVQQNPLALQHVGAWRFNEPLVLSVVENSCFLWAAPACMTANKKVVLAAVRHNGDSLQHASFDLRGDREVCLVAARHWNVPVLRFCSFGMQDDAQVVCASVVNTGRFDSASFGLRYGGLKTYARNLEDAYESFCEFDLCQRAVMGRWSAQALETGDRTRPYGNIYGQGPAVGLRFRLLIKSFLSPCAKAFEEAMVVIPILARLSAESFEEQALDARREQRRLEGREQARLEGKCSRLA